MKSPGSFIVILFRGKATTKVIKKRLGHEKGRERAVKASKFTLFKIDPLFSIDFLRKLN